MKYLKPKKIFVSVYQKNYKTLDNQDNHETLLVSLKVPYIDLIGVYRGEREKSIALVAYNQDQFDTALKIARNIAKQFSQESIMVVDSDDSAYLSFGPMYNEPLKGSFQEVSEIEAYEQNSFTYEPKTKRYFTVN